MSLKRPIPLSVKQTPQLIWNRHVERLDILRLLSRVTYHPSLLRTPDFLTESPVSQKSFHSQDNQDGWPSYFILSYVGIDLLKSVENFHHGLTKEDDSAGFYLEIAHKKLP